MDNSPGFNPALFRLTISAGVLAMMAPLATDMYLSAIPEIATELGVRLDAVQMTMTVFLAGMAAGQLFVGPLSDMIGRKTPLYLGVGLFGIMSVFCALIGDIGLFQGARFLQGMGSSVGITMARAIVRDRYTGEQSARALALITLVISTAPMLAPVGGNFIYLVFGWRAIFWTCAALAAAGLVIIRFAVEETHPPERRAEAGLRRAFGNYAILLRDPAFIGFSLVRTLSQAIFFIYLVSAPGILIVHYGMNQTGFSMIIAVNALGLAFSTQFAAPLMRRFGLVPTLATSGFALVACLGLTQVTHRVFPDHVWSYLVPIFATFCFVGILNTLSVVGALDRHGKISGSAAALVGSVQLAGGAAGASVAAILSSSVPVVTGMMTGSAICLALIGIALRIQYGREAQAR